MAVLGWVHHDRHNHRLPLTGLNASVYTGFNAQKLYYRDRLDEMGRKSLHVANYSVLFCGAKIGIRDACRSADL